MCKEGMCWHLKASVWYVPDFECERRCAVSCASLHSIVVWRGRIGWCVVQLSRLVRMIENAQVVTSQLDLTVPSPSVLPPW